jgi:branched-chain amino acid transport system ATP-binding protein
VDETKQIIQTIRSLVSERNLGVGVVEHVMGVIKELTERVIVLEAGQIIASGPYHEVAKDQRVIEAYLGGEA